MDRRQPPIKEYLQRREVQERILRKIAEVHAKATVTISRAAELSGFTENQLRDWEKRGLFNRERNAKQDGKGSPHRQYTPADLEKLAILSDLYEQRYPIGELLREAEAISQIADTLTGSHAQAKEDQVGVERLPIDQRVERMNDESSWRYFVSQALRLSLMLICEAMPDTIVGLVLPLHKDLKKSQAPEPANLRDVGQALIGWLEPNQPFCAFLDPAPHFEVASDFRIHKLMVMEANVPEEDAAQDSTLIVVQRKAKPLTLTPLVVETIRGLLALVYQNVDTWKSCFDYGTRDWVYHGTNFTGDVVPTDVLLKSLTNMVVELGGKTASGRNRWNFCCILLPQDNTLPLQQRSLVVRAQSDAAPHMLETTVVSPRDKNPGLSIKAFQSGQSFYRTEISPDDPMIAYRTQEGPIRSAIAIPISGEDGLSIAVMYIASGEANAFTKQGQCLLRMIGQMIEEVLLTYHIRQITSKLRDILASPEVVDPAFKDFLSESDFIQDVEALLTRLKGEMEEWKEPVRLDPLPLDKRARQFWEDEKLGVVSFIAIDIDSQSNRAYKYGEQVARNLTKEVGTRIREKLDLFEKYKGRKLYHVYADQFYLLLEGILLEEAQEIADRLKQALKGNYSFYPRNMGIEQPMLPGSMLDLGGVTVRVGVSAYTYRKLQEVLKRYDPLIAVSEVRNLIVDSLSKRLARGHSEGGDVIISWDPNNWDYVRL